MILIGRDLSPFTRRVAVSLSLLGLPAERRQLSTVTDQDVIRFYNPLGRVPSLVLDSGEVLIDSSAILDHIDETVGPERALIPPKGAERRKVLKLVALGHGVMEKAVAAYYERTRRPPETRYPPWLQLLEEQVRKGLEALEGQASYEGGPWLALGRMTQADITAVCALDFVTVTSAQLPEEMELSRLRGLALHLGQMPAFKQTYPTV